GSMPGSRTKRPRFDKGSSGAQAGGLVRPEPLDDPRAERPFQEVRILGDGREAQVGFAEPGGMAGLERPAGGPGELEEAVEERESLLFLGGPPEPGEVHDAPAVESFRAEPHLVVVLEELGHAGPDAEGRLGPQAR